LQGRGTRTGGRQRLVPEITRSVPEAIRTGRAVRHRLLGDRAVLLEQDDPGRMDPAAGGARLCHARREVGIRAAQRDGDRLCALRDAGVRELIDFAATRLTGRIRRSATADGGHRHAAVGHASDPIRRGRQIVDVDLDALDGGGRTTMRKGERRRLARRDGRGVVADSHLGENSLRLSEPLPEAALRHTPTGDLVGLGPPLTVALAPELRL
jgi:hypothetical protein